MTTRDYERFWVTTSDYKWVRVTTRDYQWLRARLRVTTSDYEWLKATTSHYKWLQVTTSQAMSDYKWPRMTKRLPVKLRMTTTGIGNKLRHKNVYCFLWLHNNERNKYVEKGPKNSCATLLVKVIEKYLRCRKQSFADVLQSKCS